MVWKMPVPVIPVFATFLTIAWWQLHAASLPNSTEELLRKLELDPSLLADIDKELELPKNWIEEAKKERRLKILSSSSTVDQKELKAFYGPFSERYPFIQLEHVGVTRETREVKTLLAHRAGRAVGDVITTFGGTYHQFKEAGALEDLRTIPNLKHIPEAAKDSQGLWVSAGSRYYCMAYNKKLVKQDEMPKTWEEILTHPRWSGGNLAVANRPDLWAIALWKEKGEQWAKQFLTKLFTSVKPQLRKEGLNASLELLSIGEFHALIPASSNLTYQKALTGAPVGYSCPVPISVQTGEVAILNGALNLHAAKIFVNWLLSKEGQISQYFARQVPPARKDLSHRQLNPFSEQILGKEMVYLDLDLQADMLPRVVDFWSSMWLSGGKRG
jgi:iron(III) transport system substrate-binding protein